MALTQGQDINQIREIARAGGVNFDTLSPQDQQALTVQIQKVLAQRQQQQQLPQQQPDLNRRVSGAGRGVV